MTDLFYTFSSQTTVPPTNGQVRVDADTYGAVRHLRVVYVNKDGIDAFYFWTLLSAGARVYLQDKNDHTIATGYVLTGAPVDAGGYLELAVTPLDAVDRALPANNQDVMAILVPTAAVPPEGPAVVAPWHYPQSVSSVLVSGPDEEPLTVEEGKLLAGLTWAPGDPRDDLMRGWIAAARRKVELDTGLALLRQVRDISLLYDPSKPIPLPMQASPLLSVVDPAGRRLDPSMFLVDRVARTIRFAPSARLAPLEWYLTGPLTWRIEAGWPDKQTLATQEPLLRHAVGLLTAHFATFGRDLATIEEPFEVPEGYADAVAPFVQVWVT